MHNNFFLNRNSIIFSLFPYCLLSRYLVNSCWRRKYGGWLLTLFFWTFRRNYWLGEQAIVKCDVRLVCERTILVDICLILSCVVLYVCSRDLISVQLPKTAGMEGEAMPNVTFSISTSQLRLDRCGRFRSRLSEANTFSTRRLGTGTTRIRGSTTLSVPTYTTTAQKMHIFVSVSTPPEFRKLFRLFCRCRGILQSITRVI